MGILFLFVLLFIMFKLAKLSLSILGALFGFLAVIVGGGLLAAAVVAAFGLAAILIPVVVAFGVISLIFHLLTGF